MKTAHLSSDMNKLIIIGCPYTSMSHLEMAFEDIGGSDITVINCDDIVAVDSRSLYTDHGEALHHLEDVTPSFVRYPYDLIPPHSGTFVLREATEYHKTLALAFDAISINPLASTWMLRNRAFSLSQARQLGVTIAEYTVVKDGCVLPVSERNAVKALGNCFVSDTTESLSSGIRKYTRIEEDDGDTAIILPASSLNADDVGAYLSTVGFAFLQREITAISEYRGYIIGERPFVYARDEVDVFDKSTAKYVHTNYTCTTETMSGFKKLMSNFGLGYLCFDFLLDDNGIETVIDINPYGSMPEYSSHPEPSLQLAKLMMGISQ